MTITLTSGATVQTLCDGYANRGETGKMLGPTDTAGMQWLWDIQAKKPIRATAAVPLDRGNRLTSFGFSVYRLFSSEADAQEWAYYTFPMGLLRAGTLKIYVTTKKHADVASAVLESLAVVPQGVEVDITFAFQGGAITFTTDA